MTIAVAQNGAVGLLAFVGCGPDSQISEAKKENEKCAGWLVKVLIESRLETLRQTRAMLKRRDCAWAIHTVQIFVDSR
jgi:hypothetical protein